jgi:hypothetical protein
VSERRHNRVRVRAMCACPRDLLTTPPRRRIPVTTRHIHDAIMHTFSDREEVSTSREELLCAPSSASLLALLCCVCPCVGCFQKRAEKKSESTKAYHRVPAARVVPSRTFQSRSRTRKPRTYNASLAERPHLLERLHGIDVVLVHPALVRVRAPLDVACLVLKVVGLRAHSHKERFHRQSTHENSSSGSVRARRRSARFRSGELKRTSSSNCKAAPPSASGLSKFTFFRSPSIGAPAPIVTSCARPSKEMPFFTSLGASSSPSSPASTVKRRTVVRRAANSIVWTSQLRSREVTRRDLDRLPRHTHHRRRGSNRALVWSRSARRCRPEHQRMRLGDEQDGGKRNAMRHLFVVISRRPIGQPHHFPNAASFDREPLRRNCAASGTVAAAAPSQPTALAGSTFRGARAPKRRRRR